MLIIAPRSSVMLYLVCKRAKPVRRSSDSSPIVVYIMRKKNFYCPRGFPGNGKPPWLRPWKAGKDSAGRKVLQQLYCYKQQYIEILQIFTTQVVQEVRYIRSSEERATIIILCTPKDAIRVRHIDVQMQEGFSDCGGFSIAYATALAYGKQPGRCFFEQETMRTHLMNCL